MVHAQHFGTPRQMQGPDQCLHYQLAERDGRPVDHAGSCYTLADRAERGRPAAYNCARPGCGHSGLQHIHEIGKPPTIVLQFACTMWGCACLDWMEPDHDGGDVASCLYFEECPNGPERHSRREGCLIRPVEQVRDPEPGTQHLAHVMTAAEAVRIRGIGADAPTVTEANGARQSALPYAFTSIDPMVLFRVAEIQQHGDAKYGPDNWRRLPERDHINHALAHVFGHLAGDDSDDHLGHAVVRLIFALAVNLRPGFYGEDSDATIQG